VDVQEVPTVALESSPGLLGLYGVWHYHDEALPLLPVGLEVFCELHPEASTELNSTMQSSHSHHESQNTVCIAFPAGGLTLNFLDEGELGYFHCNEASFDSGL
jgi:hypothetical protein